MTSIILFYSFLISCYLFLGLGIYTQYSEQKEKYLRRKRETEKKSKDISDCR